MLNFIIYIYQKLLEKMIKDSNYLKQLKKITKIKKQLFFYLKK